jgi:serine/threonine-protein kinase RsbW
MHRHLAFELPSDLTCIEDAVEFLFRRSELGVSAPAREAFKLRVCLCEALSNAMSYGNAGDPGKRVRLEMTLADGLLRVRVTDEGNGFDPSGLPDPTAPERLGCDGGRGIFLMRELMDDVQFNERGNEVTLLLRLPSRERPRAEASA